MKTPDTSVRDRSTEMIDAACDLLEDGDYTAVDRIIRGTLPRLPDTAYEERIRIYMLLLALPDHLITKTIQEDSLRVARHIIEHRENFSGRYRLCAYMIFGALKGEHVIDSERNEFHALHEAQTVLTHQCSRDDRDMALTIIASQSPDHDQIKLCLHELLQGANNFAITQAVTAAPISFHRETHLEYLNRALDQVKGPPAFIADILHKKIVTVIEKMEADIQSETLDRRLLHVRLTSCYATLRLLPGVLRYQAHAEYYLAYAAEQMNETEIGLIHAYTAMLMAQQLYLPHLESLARDVRDRLRSRSPYPDDEDRCDEDEV